MVSMTTRWRGEATFSRVPRAPVCPARSLSNPFSARHGQRGAHSGCLAAARNGGDRPLPCELIGGGLGGGYPLLTAHTNLFPNKKRLAALPLGHLVVKMFMEVVMGQLPTVDELALLLWLNSVPRVGPAAARLLLAHYRTPENVFHARNYRDVPGLRMHMVGELERAAKDLTTFQQQATRILDKVQSSHMSILTPLAPAYPAQLLDSTSYAPTVLYVAGDVTCLSSPGGAIVGTRSPSPEARDKTRLAAQTLAQSQHAVFSGMALGVDAGAHDGALSAQGKTIAVLGCGVDIIYPAENGKLYEDIRERGAVVSEYIPGTRPTADNLRRRNRLIVGLSRFVLVSECPTTSGAMIAARAALQQQRPLFVLHLDGPGFERERGGTEILARTDLAHEWDGQDVEGLRRYISTYTRPASAEARLDAALGQRLNAGYKAVSTAQEQVETEATRPMSRSAQSVSRTERDNAPRDPHESNLDVSKTRPILPALASSPVASSGAVPAPIHSSESVSSEPISTPVTLTVGQRVEHPTFGIGVVQRIESGDSGFIEVKFSRKGRKRFEPTFAPRLGIVPD